jgi:hypothetical protein
MGRTYIAPRRYRQARPSLAALPPPRGAHGAAVSVRVPRRVRPHLARWHPVRSGPARQPRAGRVDLEICQRLGGLTPARGGRGLGEGAPADRNGTEPCVSASHLVVGPHRHGITGADGAGFASANLRAPEAVRGTERTDAEIPSRSRRRSGPGRVWITIVLVRRGGRSVRLTARGPRPPPNPTSSFTSVICSTSTRAVMQAVGRCRGWIGAGGGGERTRQGPAERGT